MALSLYYRGDLHYPQDDSLLANMKYAHDGVYGFKMQKPKLPKTEQERAILIKKAYKARVKRGDYYD